jgi:hypothetical protein
MSHPTSLLLALVSVSVSFVGCTKREEAPVIEIAGTVAPDRLAPQEPLIGSQRVWGLRVPDGMTISSQFPRKVHLSGSRSLTSVMEALREQVSASHVEVTASRFIFERAVIQTEGERKLVRIEALTDGPLTRVYLSDITPPPVPSGLSEAEMWERAGYNPDGTIKNPSQVL